MRVRDYQESDRPFIAAMHAKQNLGYELPEFGAEIVVHKVLVDENDIPRRVLFAKKTVELYLIGDDDWGTPMWRFAGIEKLWHATRKSLHIRGFHDANFWVPPQLVSTFGRRLKESFGFGENPWPCFSRRTGD